MAARNSACCSPPFNTSSARHLLILHPESETSAPTMINKHLASFRALAGAAASKRVSAANVQMPKAIARRRRSQLLKPLNNTVSPSYHAPPALVQFSESTKRRSRLALSPVKIVVQSATRREQQHSRLVSLPIRLARPVMKEVSKEALAAVSLADIPAQYVRDALQVMGVRMLAVLASTVTSPVNATHTASLPSVVETTTTLPVRESYDLLPSHILAVHSSSVHSSSPGAGPSKPRKVTLFPAHATVLAANCANLPPLPPKGTTTALRDSEAQGAGKELDASLPLVPLSLPSPETFASLSTFLYTRRADRLLASLMPAPPSSSSTPGMNSLDQYALQLSSLPRQTLLAHALRVHGLWKNACALGVHDAKLWTVIDSAWTVLVRSMGMNDTSTSDSS